MFEDLQEAPRPPSFDEADVSDKAAWAQDLSRLSAGEEAGAANGGDAGEEAGLADKTNLNQDYIASACGCSKL